MTIRVVKPVDVVSAPDLTITEYTGRVASATSDMSACVATVRAATKESPQTPAFDEYVIVLEGEIHLKHGAELAQCTVIKAGEAFILPANTRVQWVWPGPCKYVPICLPAFSPTNCGREEASGPVAKTEESMNRLRALHAASATGLKLSNVATAGGWPILAATLGMGVLIGVAGARAMR